MREPEGQHGPARGLPSPELGQLPQAEEQALLDPDGVGDRGADGEPARSPQRAIGQRLEQLRRPPWRARRAARRAPRSPPARSPSRTAARTTRSHPARGGTGRPARAAPGCGPARAPGPGDRPARRAPGSPRWSTDGSRASGSQAPRLSLRTPAESGAPRPLGASARRHRPRELRVALEQVDALLVARRAGCWWPSPSAQGSSTRRVYARKQPGAASRRDRVGAVGTSLEVRSLYK